MTPEVDLAGGELELTGRIVPASNATFIGRVADAVVVYKPVVGERPLWDFPDGTLASREMAAYLVSEAFGWDIAPRTWLRDGPHGFGMVQLWQESDPGQEAVTLVGVDDVPGAGWCHVLDGLDAERHPVALMHEDSAALRRMAVYDVVVNNADRKGGHVLAMDDGHRHGVDHGLTFHTEHKLRTVLWGWMGLDLTPQERSGVERVRAALSNELGASLAALLHDREVEAIAVRCELLLDDPRFPAPRGGMSPVPWPPF